MKPGIKKKIILGAVAFIMLLMGLSALIQYIGGKSSSSTPNVQTGTPISTVDLLDNGQPTKQAFIDAVQNQAITNGYPEFDATADKILKVESYGNGWYSLLLNIETADSATSYALLKYDAPGTLTLKAGPAVHFYIEDLQGAGVPDAIAQKMLAKNESSDE